MPINGFDSICEDRAKIIVSKDNRESRKHIAHNNERAHVAHYRIDGVVITERDKCDFLLLNEDSKTAYLIELKGSDLVKAARQLESTEAALKNDLNRYSKEYRIVASKCKTQRIQGTDFIKYRKKWGNHLKYKTECLEENI